jgi:DNA mismatch repair protein MutS2
VRAHRGIKSSTFGFGFRAGEASRLVGVQGTWSKELEGAGSRPLPIPDILHLEPSIAASQDAIGELLELAFLGKEAAKGLDRKMGELEAGDGGWQLDMFAQDLFIEDLIRTCLTISIDGVRFPVNQNYLYQVLSHPPMTVAAAAFRQEIFRELDGDATLCRNTEKLYQEISQLLSMFKSPDHATKLDVNAFRLDLLKQARRVIDWMVEGFASAASGLGRLHEAGRRIQESQEYGILVDVLEFESRLSSLTVSLGVGGDGQVKHLEILDVAESERNRFYRSPLHRLFLRLKIFLLYGYRLSRKEIVNRLLRDVFLKISPSLTPLVQLVGQLEFYLAGLSFRRMAAERGFETTLAELDGSQPLELIDVFNPLLLAKEDPVPCSVRSRDRRPITLITGPNSGGKTRLLQTLGLTQLLGQAGMWVPASSARLTLMRGMFLSLVETETADQAEGRLGRELLRIRTLFETAGSPSLVILDELCSGTNPAEGTEIITMVLRLLERLDTVAFISTHYLDFARRLHDDPPVSVLEFLQVESRDDLTSTYQFVPGVAETSLAAATAERLGVTFEQLAALIDDRRAG